MSSSNRIPLAIAAIGLCIEAIVLVLLSTKRIPQTYATPLIITGMLMAFVPLFVVARRSRRR
ncbi:MAG TPA: hypothetical protein VM733_19770 [Thermoanaerobaculia bacterium]|nr:hypothetical protein [Thermoanaerobaculia bacterium]